MIVRTLDDGSMMLVNQTDHAKLSGLFASHWGNGRFAAPSPRESAIRAANFHDSGWARYETSPQYDAAARTSPSFFQVTTDEAQLAAFGGAIDWLSEIDPYAGLMISRHRTGLYRGRYGAVQHPVSLSRLNNDERLESFLTRYEAQQAGDLAALDLARFRVNYQLLQFWDLISLALCMREPAEEVFEFVPTGYDGDGTTGERIVMTRSGEGAYTLDPYPFDVATLSASYPYRQLPGGGFADQAAFRVAYFGAPMQLRSWRLSGA